MNDILSIANKELEEFAHIVSHDLREPLRGINNFAEILLDENYEKLDEEAHYMLGTIIKLARRQEKMIAALLEYSKVRKNALNSKESPVDTEVLIEEVCDNIQIRQRYPQVDVRIHKPLPTLRCSRTLLEHIFTNLIHNAVKFNDKSEKWIEIGTLANEIPPVFYIRDNGIGIPQRHFNKIFTIFRKLHEKESWEGGTGVGLAIVKSIINRHNGKIWLESTEGEGSVFFFSIPEPKIDFLHDTTIQK
ncbi:Cyanobacterial phytochrome B (fragment) [Desulfamplus magnetovallimortis]|uniref:histidine kinase n=1 Tax=Desulfamplus magnetovallimortis TaxID=1246637 RepID=A0A1W1HJ21_9BACT